jgi:patatin-related protein
MPDKMPSIPLFEQEIRFALVMYGGVSLAIYINGVTQEFLRLVRATAVDSNGNLRFPNARGSESVYRRLASIVRADGEGSQDDNIRTRFVVDIVAGTSAGGINGIFLGKALANGQSLDELSRLWVDQADMADLLNDSKCKDRPTFAQSEPQSLLSGRRMYNKLVRAFRGMDDNGPSKPFPVQSEMDVFATTTDIQGLELPIELADMMVHEKRHKNVLHLRFEADGDGWLVNHFNRKMNSFLAFAARATSSFPFAFEPMRLADIDGVLDQNDAGRIMARAADPYLGEFFPDYPGPDDYRNRAFGDGGYLNNKPFSHAVATLASRSSDMHAKRMLAYVEPSPDKASGNHVGAAPNFLQNTLAATLTLHQYETIREDLQRLLARNRLIERVSEVVDNVENDVQAWREASGGQRRQAGRRPGAEYATRTVSQEIADRGPGYAGYHRLKIRSVTDDLALLLTRALNLQDASDEFRAIRLIIGAWRKQRYSESAGQTADSGFLLDFDLNYRLRRLRFLLVKLDELYVLHSRTTGLLDNAGIRADDSEAVGRLRTEIRALKKELNQVAGRLGGLETDMGKRGSDNFAWALIEPLGIRSEWLQDLLRLCPAEQDMAIAKFLQSSEEAVNNVADGVAAKFKPVFIDAATRTEEILSPAKHDSLQATLRKWLRAYFDDYEYYDQVTFPIFYETEVGEAEPCSVIRISPQDAIKVYDEKQDQRRKLAGTVLFHFGAFFERLWRTNDILWGRLDAAERIICSVLPRGSAASEKLVHDAQLSIIEEQMRPQEAQELKALMVKAILKLPREQRDAKNLRSLLQEEIAEPVDAKVDAVFTACLNSEEILNYLKTSYEVNREFTPATTLDVAGRAAVIVGGMLEGVSKGSEKASASLAWVSRIGGIFWSLVQLAVPGGLGNRVFRHWLAILYAFEFALLIGSTLAAAADTQQLAVTALLLTAGTHLFVSFLEGVMSRRNGLGRAVLVGIAIIMLALMGIGVWTVKRRLMPELRTTINAYLVAAKPQPKTGQ